MGRPKLLECGYRGCKLPRHLTTNRCEACQKARNHQNYEIRRKAAGKPVRPAAMRQPGRYARPQNNKGAGICLNVKKEPAKPKIDWKADWIKEPMPPPNAHIVLYAKMARLRTGQGWNNATPEEINRSMAEGPGW